MNTKKTKDKFIYRLQKLIPGEDIGLTGWYAGVPERGYKGHPFKVQYTTSTKDENGEYHYKIYELQVADWNKAVMFRKQVNVFGMGGFFTLGYFKMMD